MDSDVIILLSEIKTAIYLLLFFVVVGVVANWVRAGILVKNTVRRELDEAFSQEASEHYEEGNFQELLVHCEEKLKSRPNHVYALWYKAKAYYHKGEYSEARKLFERVSQVEPSWDESSVQPYLKKIEATEKNRVKS